MHTVADEILFASIPRKNAPPITGNFNGYYFSLRDEYMHELHTTATLPESLHSSGSGGTAWKQLLSLQRNTENKLNTAYAQLFPELDKAIEAHIETSNGYIREFPESEITIFESDEEKIPPFRYFEAAPNRYICPAETEIRNHYRVLRSKTPWYFFISFSALLVNLALLLCIAFYHVIAEAYPEFGQWLMESKLRLYGYLAVSLMVMEFVGLIVPIAALKVRLEGGMAVALGVMFCCLAFIGGCFLLEYQHADPAANLFYNVLRWVLVGYFSLAFIANTVIFIKIFPDYYYFLYFLRSNQRSFVKAYQEEAYRLHRYLRLRKLWYAYETGSEEALPEWLSRIDHRFRNYTKLYMRLKHLAR